MIKQNKFDPFAYFGAIKIDKLQESNQSTWIRQMFTKHRPKTLRYKENKQFFDYSNSTLNKSLHKQVDKKQSQNKVEEFHSGIIRMAKLIN